MSLPDVSLPDVSLPDVSFPDVSLPDVSLPERSSNGVVGSLSLSLSTRGRMEEMVGILYLFVSFYPERRRFLNFPGSRVI